jgi:hypothetical protein
MIGFCQRRSGVRGHGRARRRISGHLTKSTIQWGSRARFRGSAPAAPRRVPPPLNAARGAISRSSLSPSRSAAWSGSWRACGGTPMARGPARAGSAPSGAGGPPAGPRPDGRAGALPRPCSPLAVVYDLDLAGVALPFSSLVPRLDRGAIPLTGRDAGRLRNGPSGQARGRRRGAVAASLACGPTAPAAGLLRGGHPSPLHPPAPPCYLSLP